MTSMKQMDKQSKIYVAGDTGLVGSTIVRELRRQGYGNLLIMPHKELDLRNQQEVNDWFKKERPEYVFLAAATVGGVVVNDRFPGTFFYDNLAIGMNAIHAAHENGVKKLLYFGSNCIYPRAAPQPYKEESLLTGLPEKTNEAYAVAKIACVKMCEFYNRQYGTDFISCMPCSAYGPGDNFDPEGSHVVPALIRKFHEAKGSGASEVVMWGTGKPYREFIYIDDIAKAAIFLMNQYSGNEPVNIGTGAEYTIGELAEIIRRVVGFEGEIVNDTSKPDGTPKKLLDSSKIFSLGWRPETDFETGIRITYEDFVKNKQKHIKKGGKLK